jgi:hypothetical protein
MDSQWIVLVAIGGTASHQVSTTKTLGDDSLMVT